MDFEHSISPFLGLILKDTGNHSLMSADIVNFEKQTQSVSIL